MKGTFARWGLYFALLVLFLLHNDLWFWNTPKRILGLPVGLLYHMGFCAVASVLMALLVNYAWPGHLEVEDDESIE